MATTAGIITGVSLGTFVKVWEAANKTGKPNVNAHGAFKPVIGGFLSAMVLLTINSWNGEIATILLALFVISALLTHGDPLVTALSNVTS